MRRLAAEYGVAHTTLGRWFARPAVARQVRALARRLPEAAGEYRIEASFCCERAKERALRALLSQADSH